MSEKVSQQDKARKLAALVGTNDVSMTSSSFLRTACPKTIQFGSDWMSDKQLKWFEDLYEEHFAGDEKDE